MNKKIVVVLVVISFTLLFTITNKLREVNDIHVVSDIQTENDVEVEKIEAEPKTESKFITIYISGAVVEEGVVVIEEGKRLADAIETLGGTTEDADTNKINLAKKLEDEGHYIVPKKGENVNLNESVNVSPEQENIESKININTATIEELDKLPGIGEATANKIINHKLEIGEFKTIEEIKNVNGIGEKKYEDIKDLICIN